MCDDPNAYYKTATWEIGKGNTRLYIYKHDYNAISMTVNHCRVLMPSLNVDIVKAIYKSSKKAYEKWIKE